MAKEQAEMSVFELEELGRSSRSSFRLHGSMSRRNSSIGSAREGDDEYELQWAAIERLETFERVRKSVVDGDSSENQKEKKVADVTKLGAPERRLLIEKLIKNIENDNLRLLQKQRVRIDRVNVEVPTIEVRYKNLSVEAECEVVKGKPLPTLWNAVKGIFSGLAKVPGLKSEEAKITILSDVSGIIKPSRMTLLLGPPGCGKTTLFLSLAGQLDKNLKVTGEISYNGFRLEEFVPEKTAAYVSQYDLHIPEMTVREILDFSARFQGVGSRAEIMKEVSRREKQAGIIPEPDIDTYMKAISVEGLERSLQTDYILKIMGLDICADTMIGDVMRRGISGGQKKRLTTAEIIVGPTKALFMDEISTGLDSSTTYQIVSCFQQLAHITETTIVVSLLQPAPETYDLFDDVILMAEGKIVYHGPRNEILNFFQECGFKCPKRKGEAEFLQEVLSRKDQEQYWSHPQEPYHYVSVNQFREKFKASIVGHKLEEDLSKPYDKSQCHESALSFSIYSLAKWELFKACMARELLLMKRNSFVYIFKTTQLSLTAIITMTVFLRTRLGVDVFHANSYLGALFYTLIINMVNGFPELAMTVSRLPVLYKQRDFYFYPAWAYAIPAFLLKFPISLIESLVWTSITYYGIGYSPEAVRFFRQFLLLLVVHQMSLSLFRFLASYFQTVVASSVSGTLSLLVLLVFGGFILPHHSMPGWLKWGFWCSPLSYAEIGLAVNEFLAPRWGKISSANTTIGKQVLTSRGLDFNGYFYWISVGALVGYILLLNVGFTLAITLRKPPVASRAIISREKLSQIKREEGSSNAMDLKNISKDASSGTSAENRRTGRMVLPFVPLTVAFRDIQYYVETPLEMREQGHAEKRLQLLHNITGAFRPGILSALMGVSGAGKTTLLDVLAGRKTGGTIEGGITIGGYPKVQQTFARISGYCEQSDIHSPHITVEESVIYSAWLRLPSQVDRTTRSDFVDEVLETIELDGIKDSLVGIPGITGLSTEQRKRLTIAVELVANPSIIFMDEPTSGLDARAAAIVMRAVKNVVGTGRTVVCTIHQPSTDIFEAFDELILMKRGGELIYAGPLGQHSTKVIEYFEGIAGIPRIRNNYNPATWMLEVTSTSVEAQLNVDFAQIYKSSSLYRDNQELVKQLSKPAPDSAELHFPTRFPQNGWAQFKACLWKQYLSYWRSPSYNLVRLIFITISSTVFAVLFWKHGNTINNQQDLFNIFGLLYITTNFFGINNSSSVLTFVATERTVLYRERYAGMYSPWAYSFAQMVIEIPYVFIQVGLFMVIIYPAIGFYWSAYKFLWFFFTMFCTLLYFVYLGMLIVSLTPNVQVASILQSPCYALLNLFSGFMVPSPQIPKWWIWFYYINPMAWTINSLLTSQYGDVDKEIMVFGEVKSISSFIKDYFGYHHDHQGFVAVILIAYPLIFGCLFAYCIEKLNFQRR
ncbi:pleiotropic drug resistance protein 3-like [Asparagus officinalis]|uniref:pleiotropic drug resistance protein 3-like n=1 Tax=Asparagus officinalis TaxID=4686 RepID=UPI00098E2804|nr:pleiotropic drug resistance protein 3-like [Asparagus officinalis]